MARSVTTAAVWRQKNGNRSSGYADPVESSRTVGQSTQVMPREADCIFCQIIEGTAEASVVYRDELVTAFMDISPVVEGHTLVIPNYHTSGLDRLDAEHSAAMMQVGTRIANAMPSSGLRCEGSNLFLANGRIAGQTVFHVHLHVIPRYAGDPFKIQIEAFGRGRPSREELGAQAGALASLLG
jgi:histidine triad (HIT) family protein